MQAHTLNIQKNKKRLLIKALDKLNIINLLLSALSVDREELENIIYNDSDNDVLDIEYNRIKLVLKALNSTPSVKDAAKELGVSERTVFRTMNIYDIEKTRTKHGEYVYESRSDIFNTANVLVA